MKPENLKEAVLISKALEFVRVKEQDFLSQLPRGNKENKHISEITEIFRKDIDDSFYAAKKKLESKLEEL